MDIAPETKELSVFISYAHEDELFLKQLDNHLSLLRNQRIITIWHNRNINAGTEWEHEISLHMETAHIILLLISASFLASNYCYSFEMKRALERHEAGKACVIPIILRPVDWEYEPSLRKLQALPTDAKPITTWSLPPYDDAFYDIVKSLRKVIITMASGNIAEGNKQAVKDILGHAVFQQSLELSTDASTQERNRIAVHLSSQQQADSQTPAHQRSPSLLRADIFPSLKTYLEDLAKPRSYLPSWRFPGTFPIESLSQRVRITPKRRAAIPERSQQPSTQDNEDTQGIEEVKGKNEAQEAPSSFHFSANVVEWKMVRHQVKRAIVLGEAGYGKSLLLASECWFIAQEQLRHLLQMPDGQRHLPLPIFIPLDKLVSELAKTKNTVLQAIVNVADTPQLGEEFRDAMREWIADHPCFFFFDGFDVITQEIWGILRPVLNAIAMRPEHSIFISCRSTTYNSFSKRYLSAFDISSPKDTEMQVDLVAFDDYYAKHFIAVWFAADKKREELLRAYVERHNLNELVRVPLSLSWLCELVTDEQSHLPERRTVLYEGRLAEYLKEAPSDLAKQAEDLVLRVAERRGDWHLSEKDVKEFITKEERAYLTKTGLLDGMEKSLLGSFSFSHDTLHEYLLASALAHMPDDRERWQWIQTYCHYDSRWPNVMRFLAGALEQPEPFLKKVRAEFYGLRALSSLLAGECLLEVDATKISPPLRDKITKDLRHLLSSPVPEEREKATEILKHLEDKQTGKMLLEWFHQSRFHPSQLAPLLALWGGDEIVDALLLQIQKNEERTDFSRIFPAENVLSYIGGQYVIRKLRDEFLCKGNTCGSLHQAAISILRSIKERQAADALLAGLSSTHDEHAPCQASIIQCLEERGEDAIWKQLARYWREGNPPPALALTALEQREYYAVDWWDLREIETLPVCLPLIRSLDAQKRYWQSQSVESRKEQEKLLRDHEAIHTILTEYKHALDERNVDEMGPAIPITHLLVILGNQHTVEIFFHLLCHPKISYKRAGAWGFHLLFQRPEFSIETLGERKLEIVSELFFLFGKSDEDDEEHRFSFPHADNSSEAYGIMQARNNAEEALLNIKDVYIFIKLLDNNHIPVALIFNIIKRLGFGFGVHEEGREIIRRKMRIELAAALREKNTRKWKEVVFILGHLLNWWKSQDIWLGSLPYEQAREVFYELLQDKDTQIRWGAIHALRSSKNIHLIEEIFYRLLDQGHLIDANLSETLLLQRESESLDIFYTILSHGTQAYKQLVLMIPEVLTTAQRVEAVRKCLHDPDAETRELAINTFARISGQEAEQDLFLCLRDESESVQWKAAQVLGRSGSLKTIEYFLQEARNTDEELQSIAVVGLMTADPSLDSRIMECLLDLYLNLGDKWRFLRINHMYPTHPAVIIMQTLNAEEHYSIIEWKWYVGELNTQDQIETLAAALEYSEQYFSSIQKHTIVWKLFLGWSPYPKKIKAPLTLQMLERLLRAFENGDDWIRRHLAIILGFQKHERLEKYRKEIK